MNVVRRLVGVFDVKRLTGHQRHDVRRVHAAFLIELDRRFRCVEGPVAQTLLDIHDHVCKVAGGIRNDLFRSAAAGMDAGAELVGSHVDLLRLWSRPFQLHGSAHRADRGHVDGCSRGLPGRGVLRGLFLLSATHKNQG